PHAHVRARRPCRFRTRRDRSERTARRNALGAAPLRPTPRLARDRSPVGDRGSQQVAPPASRHTSCSGRSPHRRLALKIGRATFLIASTAMIVATSLSGSARASDPATPLAACASSTGPGIPPPATVHSGGPQGYQSSWYGQSGY